MPNVTLALPQLYPASRTVLMSCATFVCAASYSMAALFVAKLTPAEVTPVAPVSASCTVAAQLAHVMPSIGRMIRVLLMAGIVELVRRGRGAALPRGPHAAPAPAHVRGAAQGVPARLAAREPGRRGS